MVIEGRPEVAAIAAETVRLLGLAAEVECRVGWFDDALEDALSSLGGVDHAFVDGHHEGEATLRYFARIRPWLASGATVAFDDIRWSADMWAAWKEIVRDRETADAVDLGQLGLWALR